MARGGFLDMDKFTFAGKVIESISEMVMEDTIQGPELSTIHTVFPDIVTNTEVGFIGDGGMVGVKDGGCDSTTKPWNINTRKLKWEPAAWEIFLSQCYTDLKNAATVYSLRTGVDIPDFTDTDYMNIVLEVLEKSIMDFWYRMFWFGDTAAKHVGENSGIITAGLDLAYYTILDGFWKQITTQVAAHPEQHPVVIAENAGATYAEQELKPENVQGYLAKLVFSAPLQLRNLTDKFILVTQSVYDAYEQSLMSACCLESARMALINGMEALKYKGIPVIAMPVWDKLIAVGEDTGTKLNNPHRMLFTAKSVLGIGVDDISRMGDLRIWYDQKDKKVYIRSMGQADAKLTNPEYFTLGI